MSTKASALPLPEGWGVTQLVLHYEKEDLTREVDPFAGNAVVQLRMDVEPGTAPARVVGQDRGVLAAGLAHFKVIAEGELAVGGAPMSHLEHTFEDEEGRALQQLTLYLRRGGHLYTVSGTHRAGPRFAAIRGAVLELAAALAR